MSDKDSEITQISSETNAVQMAQESASHMTPQPQSETDNGFWQMIKRNCSKSYNFIKKICPQIRHIDNAIRSRDGIEITSVILNESGKIIGGTPGKFMRIPHDIINIANSENTYDAINSSINTASRYMNFGKQGNELMNNLSAGFGNAGDQERLDNIAKTKVNNAIKQAQEMHQAYQSFEEQNADINLKNLSPQTINDVSLAETFSSEPTIRTENTEEAYLHNVNNILQKGHNRIEEMRNRLAAGRPSTTSNSDTIKDKRARLHDLRFTPAHPSPRKTTPQTARSDILQQLCLRRRISSPSPDFP